MKTRRNTEIPKGYDGICSCGTPTRKGIHEWGKRDCPHFREPAPIEFWKVVPYYARSGESGFPYQSFRKSGNFDKFDFDRVPRGIVYHATSTTGRSLWYDQTGILPAPPWKRVYKRVSRKKANPARKPKNESRASKAVKRVKEALEAGVILHFESSRYSGTAGHYHDPQRPFAILRYSRTHGNRDDYFTSAFSAADHLVEFIGVGNVIDALKTAARKYGTTYYNLDTAIRWK